jgi:hypothetical protein
MAIIKGTDKEIGAFNYELTAISTIEGKSSGWACHGSKVAAGMHQIGLSFVSQPEKSIASRCSLDYQRQS